MESNKSTGETKIKGTETFVKKVVVPARKTKIKTDKEFYLVKAMSKSPIKQARKDKDDLAFLKDVSENMPMHTNRPTEEQEWEKTAMEVAKTLKKEKHMEMAELVVLPLTDQKNILKAIQAPSAWSAFFDLQAFPHIENFTDNEDFRDNVPYFKACLDLRAEMSVGVGYDITDTTTEETSPQEQFLRDEFDRLKIKDTKLTRTQNNRDLYGNSYWYIKWADNKRAGKKYIEKIIIIYPRRMRIRLDKRPGNPIIGYAYQPPMFVPGTIPIPIPLEPKAVINFFGDVYDDKPYGYSKVKGIKEILQGRWDLNILIPIFYKHYAKPWVHWKINTEGLQPDQAQTFITDMFNAMEDAGPDSDMVTTDRWEATSFGAGNQTQDPIGFIEDFDNQLFGNMKVPETYFKAKGTTDRMILKQDDNFKREMIRIQTLFREKLGEELIKPMLQAEFGPQTTTTIDPETKVETKVKNYEVPEIIWEEVFEESKEDTANRVRADYVAGGITLNEFRKETDRDPLEENQVEGLKTDMTDEGSEVIGDSGGLGVNPETLEPKQPTVETPTEPKAPKATVPTVQTASKRREVIKSDGIKITLEED